MVVSEVSWSLITGIYNISYVMCNNLNWKRYVVICENQQMLALLRSCLKQRPLRVLDLYS